MSNHCIARWFMFQGTVATIVLSLAGCATTSTYQAVQPIPARTVTAGHGPAEPEAQSGGIVLATYESGGAAEGPLTLGRLLGLAETNNPGLAAVRARADAARGRLIQAGLYPNPTVGWEADQLGDQDNAAGEQGPVFQQEIVTGGKLQLAQEAAAHGVTAADWQAMTRGFEVLTRVRLAYYDLLAAQRETIELSQIIRQLEEFLQKTEKIAAAGVGNVLPADALRVRVELQHQRDRLGNAQEREKAARPLLAAAIGLPTLPVTNVHGKLDANAPHYEFEPTRSAVFAQHSQVLELQAAVFQAEAELRLAQSVVTPNLQFRVRPFYDFPQDRQKLMAEVAMPWPLFNRNQGNILAAQAAIAQAQAEVRVIQGQLAERLADVFRRYGNARRQVVLYQQIQEDAQKSLDQMRLIYENRGERFLEVLDSQRTLNQARLEYIKAQGDLWIAVSEIEGLLQRGGPLEAGPHP